MTKEEIFQEITGNPNIDDLSVGDRMMPDEIRRAMDMWAESEVKKLSLNPPVSALLLLFDKMIKEENEALGKVGFYNQYGRETHANNKYCLAIVKSLIERRFSDSR